MEASISKNKILEWLFPSRLLDLLPGWAAILNPHCWHASATTPYNRSAIYTSYIYGMDIRLKHVSIFKRHFRKYNTKDHYILIHCLCPLLYTSIAIAYTGCFCCIRDVFVTVFSCVLSRIFMSFSVFLAYLSLVSTYWNSNFSAFPLNMMYYTWKMTNSTFKKGSNPI